MTSASPEIRLERMKYMNKLVEFYSCPSCGTYGEFVGSFILLIDYDGILREMRDTASFFAQLILQKCPDCDKNFYTLELDFVDNPDVSKRWILAYFFGRTPLEKPNGFFLVTYRGDNQIIPHSWFVTQENTPEGILTGHALGPFSPEDDDVAGFAKPPKWAKARAIIGQVLPLVATYFPAVTSDYLTEI